uniref:Thymidine kinase n=1 Tax=Parastrongyloides trichosuri TaxID=131310 RepID=A0A0N4Z804_PARTI
MQVNYFHIDEYTNRGMIQLIIGPMFSGKSTELFRLTNLYKIAKKKVVVVKYENDTRYDEKLASTHDKKTVKAISAVHLKDIFDKLKVNDVIGIDEGQFFDDIVYVAEELAKLGKLVIVAALDGDFQRRPFETITGLYPLAEKIEKINAVCRLCGYFASFTFRTTTCSDLEVIGGEEMYKAVCRECYYELKKKQHEDQINNNNPDETNNETLSISNNQQTKEYGLKKKNFITRNIA